MSIADPISAGYHEMPLPMIVVACKADSTVISAETVADILDPFHVGLVEATATTEKGKNKMRMALAWVIQVNTFMKRKHPCPYHSPQAIVRRRGSLSSSTSLASTSTANSGMSTSQTV